jgi:hypothetical protein
LSFVLKIFHVPSLPIDIIGNNPPPWLCHTFSSKVFFFLFFVFSVTYAKKKKKALGYLSEVLCDGTISSSDNVVFWCTKTLTQPGGPENVFAKSSEATTSFLADCGIKTDQDFYAQKQAKKL